MIVNKKKEQVLLKSRELFWKHGFRRVTVEEICAEAGVSKMTFYKFFPDKISVAKAVFEREAELGMVRFRELIHADAPSAEKIAGMIRLKSEAANNISREFLQDFYTSEKSELRDYVNEVTKRSWDEVIEEFKDAQRKGIFRKDFKPELIFLIAQKFSESLNDERLQSLYSSPHDLIVELSGIFCYGISPRTDK